MTTHFLPFPILVFLLAHFSFHQDGPMMLYECASITGAICEENPSFACVNDKRTGKRQLTESHRALDRAFSRHNCQPFTANPMMVFNAASLSGDSTKTTLMAQFVH